MPGQTALNVEQWLQYVHPDAVPQACEMDIPIQHAPAVKSGPAYDRAVIRRPRSPITSPLRTMGLHEQNTLALKHSNDKACITRAPPSSSSSSSSTTTHEQSSSSSEQKRRDPESYVRKARHKTRHGKYDSHLRHKPSESPAQRKKKHKKKQKREPERERKRNREPVKVRQLQSKHISKSRLTLDPGQVGLYTQGRSSGPTRGHGLPDLMFSEMRFLQNKNRDRQVDGHEKTKQAKDKSRSDKRRKTAEDDGISAFFDTVRKQDRPVDNQIAPEQDRGLLTRTVSHHYHDPTSTSSHCSESAAPTAVGLKRSQTSRLDTGTPRAGIPRADKGLSGGGEHVSRCGSVPWPASPPSNGGSPTVPKHPSDDCNNDAFPADRIVSASPRTALRRVTHSGNNVQRSPRQLGIPAARDDIQSREYLQTPDILVSKDRLEDHTSMSQADITGRPGTSGQDVVMPSSQPPHETHTRVRYRSAGGNDGQHAVAKQSDDVPAQTVSSSPLRRLLLNCGAVTEHNSKLPAEDDDCRFHQHLLEEPADVLAVSLPISKQTDEARDSRGTIEWYVDDTLEESAAEQQIQYDHFDESYDDGSTLGDQPSLSETWAYHGRDAMSMAQHDYHGYDSTPGVFRPGHDLVQLVDLEEEDEEFCGFWQPNKLY